jgi:hypothetical protein
MALPVYYVTGRKPEQPRLPPIAAWSWKEIEARLLTETRSPRFGTGQVCQNFCKNYQVRLIGCQIHGNLCYRGPCETIRLQKRNLVGLNSLRVLPKNVF